MRSQEIDYSKYNSIELCKAENLSPQIINRALALLQDPKLSSRPFDARGLATWITKIKNQPNGKVIFNTTMQIAWEKQAIATINHFNSQELANSIYAFGILGIKASEAFIHAWTQKATATINHFNSQELANSIYAFGILGVKPSNAFIKEWEKHAIEKIKDFNSQGLANSIYAFGKLGIKPSDAFIHAWTQKSTATINHFNSQDLANSIYAFGILGIKPSEAFIHAWTQKSTATTNNFNSQNLTNSIYAFAILGIKPSSAFIKEWEKQAMATIKDFNSQELANSIYAFAKLGTKPSEAFIKEWEKQAIATIKDFNSQNLANSIYAFVLIQSMSLTLKNLGNLYMLENLYKQLSNNKEAILIAAAHTNQLYTIMRVLKLNNIAVEDGKILELLDVIKSNEKSRTSTLQTSVFSTMKGMNLNVFDEVFVEEIATSIDILYNVGNKKIAIQVDGPTHYSSDGTENSETKLNTILLKEIAGFDEVVRIKYSDFNMLSSHEERKNFINTIIKPFDDIHKGENLVANSTPNKAPSKISSASTDQVAATSTKPSWAAIAQKNSSVTQNNRKC